MSDVLDLRFVMLPRDPVRWLCLTASIQRSDMLGATAGCLSSRGEKLGDGPGSWSASSISNLTESKNRLYGKWFCGSGSVYRCIPFLIDTSGVAVSMHRHLDPIDTSSVDETMYPSSSQSPAILHCHPLLPNALRKKSKI